jgi:hypothetical protein
MSALSRSVLVRVFGHPEHGTKFPPLGMPRRPRAPVDWEAVRVLAIELGAREAARRLGIKESTVLSRARRDKWNRKNSDVLTGRLQP